MNLFLTFYEPGFMIREFVSFFLSETTCLNLTFLAFSPFFHGQRDRNNAGNRQVGFWAVGWKKKQTMERSFGPWQNHRLDLSSLIAT